MRGNEETSKEEMQSNTGKEWKTKVQKTKILKKCEVKC